MVPAIILGDGRAPTNAITVVTSDGFSRYRALTVKLDKRFLAALPVHGQLRAIAIGNLDGGRSRLGRGRIRQPQSERPISALARWIARTG
jgi:hypothetical protein